MKIKETNRLFLLTFLAIFILPLSAQAALQTLAETKTFGPCNGSKEINYSFETEHMATAGACKESSDADWKNITFPQLQQAWSEAAGAATKACGKMFNEYVDKMYSQGYSLVKGGFPPFPERKEVTQNEVVTNNSIKCPGYIEPTEWSDTEKKYGKDMPLGKLDQGVKWDGRFNGQWSITGMSLVHQYADPWYTKLYYIDSNNSTLGGKFTEEINTKAEVNGSLTIPFEWSKMIPINPFPFPTSTPVGTVSPR